MSSVSNINIPAFWTNELENFTRNYYELLNGEYSGINLTRINDYEDFKNKQIIDSVVPLFSSGLFKKQIQRSGAVLDIGFGGGFPILPLAFLCPEIKFLGVDCRAKKVKVVSEISKKLEVNNTQLFHSRIEDVLG